MVDEPHRAGAQGDAHFGLSGGGVKAWFGWPDIPQLEKLVNGWVRATDEVRRKQLATVALSEVAYVPWGE